ncbi:MAG: DUF924 domain-containing protein [Roseitalea sp.]|nr:DUF924 domain-containing protein [Roseitalea sp.]MBO6722937.1 DUF924 domain-containing protein [Roseitalea sp.]MBO6743597.1 DUF924 domain-containing protein [Roseitalea sp.]
MAHEWTKQVLDFWFNELTPEQWFKRDAGVDETIQTRFAETYEAVCATPAADLATSPRAALAAVIVLDQFPRNMFRDSARAFQSDAHARAVADAVIAAGHDTTMTGDERHFLYMPFMHSEALADQDRAIDLFTALGKEDGVKYAHLHRDVIVRFGRFPHRNAVLGRQTTAEEQKHLDVHGGF